MATVRCPMCGKSNPPELDECQFCGARLSPVQGSTPDTAKPIRPGDQPIKRDTAEFEKVKLPDSGPIHAGDAPTKKDTGELEKALPSWLRSVRQGSDVSGTDVAAGPPAAEQPPSAPAAAPESDWLSGLGRAASQDDESVPDWLSGLRTGGEADAGGQAEEVDSGLGTGNADWLSRLGGESQAEPPAGPAATAPSIPPSVESTPSWLDTLPSQPVEPDRGPTASPGGDDTPDWLSGLSSVPAVESPVLPETPAPSENLPGWLAGGAPTLETPPAAPAESVPGWLSDLEGKAGTGSGTPAASAFGDAAPASPNTPAETPSWLSQMKADFSAAGEIQEPKDSYEPAPKSPSQEKGTGPLPDWLAGTEQTGPASSGSAAAFSADEEAAAAQGSQASFSMENPAWLSQLKPEKRAEIEGEAGQENLEAGELPSWVQAMRPVEAVVGEAKSAPAEEVQNAETSGPLAGLQGVIPAGPGLGNLRKPPSYSSKLQVSENQQKYAAFLERMVMQEADAKEPGAQRLGSSRAWRWLITGLLAAATGLPLLAAFLSPSTPLSIAPDWPLPSSDRGVTTALIDELPASAPVLVAFDYDPALSGELEAVAAPIIDHLLARGPRLSVISTNPTGSVLADHFFQNTLLVDIYHYTSGSHYANLGYLPGGQAGLAAFAANPLEAIRSSAWQTTFLDQVTNLGDFGVIIVITDNGDTGRAWVEQTGQRLDGTPLIMIVSAQAEPMLQPYFLSGQVKGLVTGLVDAKIYEQGYARPGTAKSYWNSLSVGLLVVVLLIVGGALWNVLAGWRARRNRTGEES